MNIEKHLHDNEIICIDKDGNENKYLYNLEIDGGQEEWLFMIKPLNIEVDDFFEFTVRKINENNGKVIQMTNHLKMIYSAKGIPEKMIEESSKVLNLEITSSTNIESKKSFANECRSGQATKVWERLSDKGKAKYNLEIDTYFYTGRL